MNDKNTKSNLKLQYYFVIASMFALPSPSLSQSYFHHNAPWGERSDVEEGSQEHIPKKLKQFLKGGETTSWLSWSNKAKPSRDENSWHYWAHQTKQARGTVQKQTILAQYRFKYGNKIFFIDDFEKMKSKSISKIEETGPSLFLAGSTLLASEWLLGVWDRNFNDNDIAKYMIDKKLLSFTSYFYYFIYGLFCN